jgi:3-oxoacyl-[acyl-carrier-protein] synthase III
MSKAALKALDSAGLSVNEIDAFIPHQANVRIIETRRLS